MSSYLVRAIEAWRSSWRWKVVYISIFLVLVNTICVLKVGFSNTGRVVDKSTGNPISGAAVIVTWHGEMFGPWFLAFASGGRLHGSVHPRCYHVEFARTDEDGHFKTRNWIDYGPLSLVSHVSTEWREVMVYSGGYRVAIDAMPQLDTFALEPFNGSSNERVDELELATLIGCGGSVSERNAEPYLKAISAEISLRRK